MKALFFGVIAEDIVFPYPLMSDAERERVQTLIDLIGHFARAELDPVAIDAQGQLPAEVLASARRMGLLGLSVPVAHGGMGLTHSGYARVLAELASKDASLASLLYTHEGLGVQSLRLAGTKEQQARWLPLLASGDKLCAFALTETSGTDPTAIRTRLRPTDGGYLVSGTKRWVTGADAADVFVTFARTSPVDSGQKPRMSAFLLEKGPGVKVASPVAMLGLRGLSVCDVELEDVFVPEQNLLGELGKGYRVAMETLNIGRIALSATLVGQCRAVVNAAINWSQERRSFGRPISDFPLIKDKITRMMADTWAVESMTYLTAGLVDADVEDFSLESAICRVAGSEALWRVVNDAMQLGGGAAFMQPHDFERHLRNARGAFVFDGTNETLRCFIALSGLQGPGRKLTEVVSAMREPVKGFGLLRDFAMRKVKETFRRERLGRAHPLLSREAVILEEATEELGRAAERALRDHGREIAEMQYVQLRLANIAIDLYALTATVARTTRAIQQRGEEGARRELDLTAMFAGAASSRIRGHLERLEHNDDELRKVIASRTYTDNAYPFDVI